ncbi:MAG: RNA polymerase sigma factor [bacterium]
MAKCAQGDESAWAVLVHRHGGLVYAIPRRMGLDPSDADDVFQITFASLAEEIGSLRKPDRVRAWLATAAHRVALKARARRREELLDTAEDLPDPGELPSEELERLQDRQLVQRALASLSTRCRELLERLYFPKENQDGAGSYESVAKDLDMPLGSVGPTRMRCLEKLLNEFRKLAEET